MASDPRVEGNLDDDPASHLAVGHDDRGPGKRDGALRLLERVGAEVVVRRRGDRGVPQGRRSATGRVGGRRERVAACDA